MRILVNILPIIKLTSRTSSNASSHRYTSLVKVISQKYEVQSLLCTNSAVRCFCRWNDKIKGFNKKSNTEFTCSSDPYRVLLVLLNYHDVYECCMRYTIRSIFLKTIIFQGNGLTNQLKSKDSFTDKEQTFNSIAKYQPANVDYLKFVEDFLNTVKHYWDIKDVKFCFATANDKKGFDVTNFLNRSPFMKIKKEVLWHKTMPFSVSKGHSGNTLPMIFAKNSFSTSTAVGQEKAFSGHKASPKCDPNYNFPHLSKIFGTENLLMRSDAYNQSLIEAAKRRAAVDESAVDVKKFKNFAIERPKVVHIKGCSVPKLKEEYLLKSVLDSSSKPCPPPLRPTRQAASSGCKKDDASKPPEFPDHCKDELEKLERNKQEEIKKKRNKMPTGCEDPKCNKNDPCNKIKKNPHKTASNEQSSDKYQCLTEPPIIVEQINNYSSKGTSYKLPGCRKPSMKENELHQVQMKEINKKDVGSPSMSDSSGKVKSEKPNNPCLEEDKEYKPKCNEDPCKEDKTSCDAVKRSPGKSKDSDEKYSDGGGKDKQTQTSTKENEIHQVQLKESNKKDIGSTSKSDSSGKVKSEKQKNPCLEEDKEYKPKCNEDNCKEDTSSADAAKTNPGKSKDSDNKKYPCGSRKRKQGLNKRYKKRGNPCKRKKSDGAIRQRHDPCKRDKQPEDPSMKKNPCAGNKQPEDRSKEQKRKEDPCKKIEPSGGSKGREDRSKTTEKQKLKEDPCKKKESSGESKMKEDPCQEQIQREDPCKKREPSGFNKEKDAYKKQKQKEDPCKTREPSGGSEKKEDPCKKQKLKEDPCKKRKSSGESKIKEEQEQSQKEDPCKKLEPSGLNKESEDTYKKQKQSEEEDPCKKRETSGGSKVKEDPCAKQKLKDDPCKKRDSSGDNKAKEDPCKKREPRGGNKEKEDPCKKQKLKKDPCKKKEPSGEIKKKEGTENRSKDQKQKEDPCKKREPSSNRKQKDDPSTKREPSGGSDVKEDPCKKREPSGESKKKEDPCKEQKQKEDPYKKRESSGISKEKEDPCKRQRQKEDPSNNKNTHADTNLKGDSCKKEKEDPCLKKKSSPCVNAPKKENDSANPSTTKMDQIAFSSSSKKPKKETRPNCEQAKSKRETIPNCGQAKNKRETRPNCGQAKKYYSTLAKAGPRQSSNSRIKCTLTNLPSIRNKHFYNFAYKRYFSSKRKDKDNKTLDELGRESQCKAVESPTPAQRKPAYNPHPREGLRQCYPTYDMDCKKFCKDSRKSACRQFKFLKDTDNSKRTNKK